MGLYLLPFAKRPDNRVTKYVTYNVTIVFREFFFLGGFFFDLGNVFLVVRLSPVGYGVENLRTTDYLDE